MSRDLERRARDDRSVRKFWLSEGRPRLDPRFGECVNPGPGDHNQCKAGEGKLLGNSGDFTGSRRYIYSSNPDLSWQPLCTLRLFTTEF